MTVDKKNLTRSELQIIWGEIFQKGAQARQALENLNTVQFKRLINSEPLPAIALGSVLSALKTIATLAKGTGDTTTLQAIADALEAAANLPTREQINGKIQLAFFEFNPALQKMFDELIVFCRN
jgi:hypothetical protein